MKKQSLNEEISRIKGMMKKINEQHFDDFDTQITPEELTYNGDQEFERAQQVAGEILSEVANREVTKYSFFDDYSFSSGELMIAFITELGSIYYHFDVNFGRNSSFTPGRSHMSNGDPGYPDEYTDAEYTFDSPHIVIYDEGDEIYKGKDFTDIENLELSNGQNVMNKMVEEFDEEIQIYNSERDDEPDYED